MRASDQSLTSTNRLAGSRRCNASKVMSLCSGNTHATAVTVTITIRQRANSRIDGLIRRIPQRCQGREFFAPRFRATATSRYAGCSKGIIFRRFTSAFLLSTPSLVVWGCLSAYPIEVGFLSVSIKAVLRIATATQEFHAMRALVYFLYPAVVDRQDALRLLARRSSRVTMMKAILFPRFTSRMMLKTSSPDRLSRFPVGSSAGTT
jgi:hypothetical protein